jgi:nitrogen fixation protein FixH
MDVVDMAKHLYKKIEERENDIATALSQGAVKDWEQYKMSVGEIRGLSLARDEIRTLLERNVDDVEDFISS